jgi:two-component system, OmpR family, response regulator
MTEDVRVLVVEDDVDIGPLLTRGLIASGFAADWADTLSEGMRRMTARHPEAVLLDVMLPDGSGHDFCRSLRQQGFGGPILFLSAKDEVADRADGLAAGGDDYIVKPFEFQELLARLRAQLMRRQSAAAQQRDPEFHGMVLDLERRQARFGDAIAKLTQRECDLLVFFMQNPNKPLARGDIFDKLWLDQGGVSLNVVDVYIGYLRTKMSGISQAGGPVIATVRGRGFMLERQ